MYSKPLEVEFRLIPTYLLPEITAALQQMYDLSVSADTIICKYLDREGVLKWAGAICTDCLPDANPELYFALMQNAVNDKIEEVIQQLKLSETSALFYRKNFDGATDAWQRVNVKAFIEKRAQQRWEQVSQNFMTVDEARRLLTQP